MSRTNNSRFSFDKQEQDTARIKVIGVGGGGGNAVNNMIEKGLNSVEYIALNTDNQALKNNLADNTIQVGGNLTNGLGAGARPEIGREAVEENRHDIEEAVDNADMLFITAGMGGGTGTGGAPVVASIAKRKSILTVAIVTTPFECEGKIRMQYAYEGISELKKNCDTVIVIPNERLLDISDDNTTLIQAFEKANEVLYNATRGISDLILMPGLINLDFADVRTTMLDGGAAIMGAALADGTDRAEIAAREAINSPLLNGVSIRGARNVLVNISAGSNLGMRETTTATSIIQQEAGDDAEIIMGTVLDESYNDEMRVTVIATGFEINKEEKENKISSQKSTVLGRSDRDKIKQNIPSADARPRRSSSRNTPFYKGQDNLKNLDTPAIHRRKPRVRSINNDDSEEQKPNQEQQSQTDSNRGSNSKTGPRNELLNERKERINKRDSDQPAFLRKIMD